MQFLKKANRRARKLQIKTATKSCAKIVVKRPIRASLISSIATNRILKKMMKIDDIVGTQANGMYAIHAPKGEPHYKIKQLCEYARKIGKKTSELNDQELERFLVR